MIVKSVMLVIFVDNATSTAKEVEKPPRRGIETV